MLKLMKYELRKMRTVLLAMLGGLVVLELAFVIGYKMEKPDVWAVSMLLITMLVFAVYGYIIVAGIVSYSRELTNRTGYLVFMTPTRPIGVVLSKLVFTLLAALAVTAAFGVVAYLDYAFLFNRLDIDPDLIKEVVTRLDLMLKVSLGDLTMSVDRLILAAVYVVGTILIEVMFTMCTAYLAITLSATLLQNKKGFVRTLVSVVLFFAISWGASWLNNKIVNLPKVYNTARMMRALWITLGFNLALSAAFACASAALLKYKVNL